MYRRFPRYPDDADYQTNAASYYEDLARKNKLIKKLAKRIWEYDKILADNLEEIEEVLRQVIDKIGEGFNEEIYQLLVKWVEDGTLDHIINETLMNKKADKSYVDKLHENVTTQLAHIALDITTLGAKADANFYDETTKKYYTDETRTTEAFDNTDIFRNAVNFLHENGGGTIYVPAGKYCFRKQIFWKSDVSMRGAGMETTFLYIDGEVFYLINLTKF